MAKFRNFTVEFPERLAELDQRFRPKRIRSILELDKRFYESAYCSDVTSWSTFDVDNFQSGPSEWVKEKRHRKLAVHEVLETVRHAVAHSNLFFGGKSKIEHVYLGTRRERDSATRRYRVIRCTIDELDHLMDIWISNVRKLRVSPSLIWHELEDAA